MRPVPRIARCAVLAWMAAGCVRGMSPDAARAERADRPAESGGNPVARRTFSLEPSLRVTVPGARFSFEGPDGVGFDLDAATLGAAALSDLHARLKIKSDLAPAGADEWIASLRLTLDPGGTRILVITPDGTSHASLPVQRGSGPIRISLMIRDQIALHVIPSGGQISALVWKGRLTYRLRLPEADQYLLCGRLSASIEGRELARREIFEGIEIHRISEIGDLCIQGTAPLGEPFDHVYEMDPTALEQRVDQAVSHLVRTLRAGPEEPDGGRRAVP